MPLVMSTPFVAADFFCFSDKFDHADDFDTLFERIILTINYNGYLDRFLAGQLLA